MSTDDRLALLIKARDALTQLSFVPGVHEGFTSINYCKFCSYSEDWIAKHGHGTDCVLAELDQAIAKATAK